MSFASGFMIMDISEFSTIGHYAKLIHLFLSGIFGKVGVSELSRSLQNPPTCFRSF